VWVLSVLKSKTGLQVGLERGLVWVRLDGIEKLLVNVELSLLALIVHLVLLLLDVEDLSLGGLLLLGLDAIEESVLEVRGDGDLADVDLGLGGGHVLLVDATKWATVELERAGDEQETRRELLEEDNTLASMATSDQDEDGAWRDALSERVGVLREGLSVGAKLLRLVLSWVEAWESLSSDLSRATVLVAADGLLGDARGLGLLLGLGLGLVGLLPLLDEPEASLVEHATVRQTHDARLLELGVDWGGASLLFLLSSGWCHFSATTLF